LPAVGASIWIRVCALRLRRAAKSAAAKLSVLFRYLIGYGTLQYSRSMWQISQMRMLAARQTIKVGGERRVVRSRHKGTTRMTDTDSQPPPTRKSVADYGIERAVPHLLVTVVSFIFSSLPSFGDAARN
jgi:hypothetical protein